MPGFNAEVLKAFPCLPAAKSVCYCCLSGMPYTVVAQGTPFSLESWFAQDSVKCVPAARVAALPIRLSHGPAVQLCCGC